MNPGRIDLTDAALVQGALGDDADAFGHLYRRFYPRLVRLVLRKTGDRVLAEDVAQDTLLKALDKLDTFDRTRPLWPWLKVIATNLAVDAGRKRSREVEWDPGDAAGVAAEELPSCEDGMVLAQVLSNLPDRQRVAVSLRYLEDWESSEAASFLGLSIPAFEQLLFRARKRARLEYSRIAQGALGVLGLPARWLRQEVSRFGARVPGARRVVEAASQLGPVTWSQAVAGSVALLVALPGAAGNGARDPDLPERHGVHVATRAGDRSDEGRAPATRSSREAVAAQNRTAGSADPAPPPSHEEPHRTPGLGEMAKDVTDGSHRVQEPEDATIMSLAFVPGSGGKRAYALGSAHCGFGACPSVLFATRDGGGSWRRLPASGLSGYELEVAPGTHGKKLFAMSPAGLQVSTDGGRTFALAGLPTVPPLTGSMAISPGFDKGHPIMLIGGDWLVRYDDSDASTMPDASTPFNGPFEPVFAPDYPSDPRFLLGASRLEDGWLQPTVYACRESGCTWAHLPDAQGRPTVRPRPDYARSNVVYAFASNALYRSDDVWGYTRLATPWPESSRLSDLAVVDNDGTLFAAVHSVGGKGGEGLFRSEDGGESWSPVRSPVFARGAISVVADGERMIVALPQGLACSADGGRSWDLRC
ncbi:MAG TPA: sigma-70 family RNA polymerase sigma factor [Actinomycetota bacterium]|nr:sigma-70 family RNA polymerase sigma factor [Actinomycetota bacterium]